jgi:peptidoglycan/LPS O-acetylase OafA/YrhL
VSVTGHSGRLHHLDGIRGIAALGVVVGHSVWPNDIKHYGFLTVGLWVDFFFVRWRRRRAT